MVGRAAPNAVKKMKQHRIYEEHLLHAVQAYYEGQQGYRTKKSLRDIAEEFEVSHTTLGRRVRMEGTSMLEFNASKQKLTVTEENVLVRFILESGEIGFPLSHHQIMQHADAVLESRLGPGYEPVGQQWVFNFLNRRHNELQPHWSKALDTQRAQSLNPAAVESWFKVVEENVVKAGIRKEDIYGMDESGFPMAYSGKERVISGRGIKTQHKQGGANPENITGVVTICADGTTVRPLIIFKGQRLNASWNNRNISNAYFTSSENGWTDANLGLRWLSDIFDVETKVKAEGRKRILILDGHSSHYSAPFLTFAREHNIDVLGYPPHCTHALQGLDVVCFGKMKEAWKKVVSEIEQEIRVDVTKADFLYLFGTAYSDCFTTSTIEAAFRVTGIYPFNKNVITAEQMKPSTTTSVKGEFPLPQPSPVRAILAAYNPKPPVQFRDQLNDTPSTPRWSASQRILEDSPSLGRRRFHDENIDPALYTPHKRLKSLHAGLGATASGSFLVSSDPYKSSTPILPPVLEVPPSSLQQPNWELLKTPERGWMSRESMQHENETLRKSLGSAKMQIHARDLIIEGVHAQLVYQNLHLQKTNRALNAKENRKKERTVLLDNEGQVFTSESFMKKVGDIEAAKKVKLEEKKMRAEARKARKEAMAAVGKEWAKIKKRHEVNIKAWEEECQVKASEGIAKRDWPKKPTRPRKPKVVQNVEEGIEGDEDDEDDDEDTEAES